MVTPSSRCVSMFRHWKGYAAVALVTTGIIFAVCAFRFFGSHVPVDALFTFLSVFSFVLSAAAWLDDKERSTST